MKKLILILLISNGINMFGQLTINEVLAEIENNNTSLKAQEENEKAQVASFNIGRELANPEVSYDYFIGSPSTAGNQTDIAVTQPFDFPTTYKKKKELAASKTISVGYQTQALRQNIMQDAKLICVEIIFQEKLKSQLEQQKDNIASILQTFEEKLLKGSGNGMDVSKAQLQLMQVETSIQIVNTNITQLNKELSLLNGGLDIVFSDTLYFMNENTKSLDDLKTNGTKVNPLKLSYDQNKEIAIKNLAVAKANILPKMEAGYHYQGILGQTFQGVHFGFSIPLWENKNEVKYYQEQQNVAEAYSLDYNMQVLTEIQMHYESYENHKTTLAKYQAFFDNANNLNLLRKALDNGQLKAVEYFNEINYFNQSKISYLTTEKEMYKSIVMMTKYEN